MEDGRWPVDEEAFQSLVQLSHNGPVLSVANGERRGASPPMIRVLTPPGLPI
jgi:hypothetical protein